MRRTAIALALAGFLMPVAAQAQEKSNSTPVIADFKSGQEAAKILAHLDFLADTCQFKITADREQLIGAMMYQNMTRWRDIVLEDLKKEGERYGLQTVCRGLARTYGWKEPQQ